MTTEVTDFSRFQSLPALREARQHHANYLAAIDAAIEIISQFDARKYAGKRIAVALEEYLDEAGGRATYEECLRDLKAGGCDLGERAESNLKTVITLNGSRFAARGDRVFLLGRELRAS